MSDSTHQLYQPPSRNRRRRVRCLWLIIAQFRPKQFVDCRQKLGVSSMISLFAIRELKICISRTNINTAARFTINDTAWPITNFWLGVQNLDDTADNWHYDDTKTNYNASEWNLPSSPAGADCVITRDQSSFNWTTVNCQQTNATNLLCQDVPTNKTCPAKFRQASPTMCYQLSTPSTATSYQQALSQCQAMNATLPSFHNYSEWKDFLKQKGFVDAIQGYPMLEPGFWIGLKDVTGNGTWVWADKSNYDWNYWTVGTEPKQAGACVVADFKMPEFTWRTEPCMSTVTFAVMCQLRLVPQTNSKKIELRSPRRRSKNFPFKYVPIVGLKSEAIATNF